jgi:hypothetical protein
MNIAKLKHDLPNMPDEVIEDWLLTHYHRFGWPPKIDNEWRYILRPGNDLSYLKQLKWKKEMFHLSANALSSKDKEIIVGICRAHILNEENIYSVNMSDGRDRFDRCLAYIKDKGVFPKAPVLQRRKEGFWILDGNHRLTAYFFLYGYFNVNIPKNPDFQVNEMQEFWIASDGS